MQYCQSIKSKYCSGHVVVSVYHVWALKHSIADFQTPFLVATVNNIVCGSNITNANLLVRLWSIQLWSLDLERLLNWFTLDISCCHGSQFCPRSKTDTWGFRSFQTSWNFRQMGFRHGWPLSWKSGKVRESEKGLKWPEKSQGTWEKKRKVKEFKQVIQN